MRKGWWKIDCTLDGSPADLFALSQETKDRIATLIRHGFHAGEIIEEEDPMENDTDPRNTR